MAKMLEKIAKIDCVTGQLTGLVVVGLYSIISKIVSHVNFKLHNGQHDAYQCFLFTLNFQIKLINYV